MSSTVLIRPEQVLAVGADAREGVQRFLALRFVEAFLHQLGVAEDGGERRSQLMAHVGDELRLVLARDLKLFNSVGEFARSRLHLLEQPRVLDGDHGLVGEGRRELDLLVSKRPHGTRAT